MFDRYLVSFGAMPHLLFTALLALTISALVGRLGKRTRRERLVHGVWFFACSMAAVIAGSWLMFIVHG